ncbi:alanine/glycine:cation symporter family protein [Ignatzschineria larvae DSM 13226]|uniref:Alanine/glycine:cation symporter family protein n=1 Tax=Ignatzschineria larvae DSM 13226 TaxID=1111732 RepID=A0ABZ3BZ21_9GAMM|nr:alanine/glycine:cation symporter family protein [Ignatzschineria larvae]
MDVVKGMLYSANDLLWSYPLVLLLILVGVYFSIKTAFLQFRCFKEMWRLLKEYPRNGQGISSFQSFSLSLASRIGSSNILGVALAISIGGPGAVFWMWCVAFLGMATSFAENTLGQLYKVKDGDLYRGGTAYYIEKALGWHNYAAVFALLLITSFGVLFTLVQSNIIAQSFSMVYSLDEEWVVAFLVGIIGVIIVGGLRRIVHVTEILVPFMLLIYLGVTGYIMLRNITLLPDILSLIVNNALGFRELLGGGMGIALVQGTRRGIFSNEAGTGSISSAGASANVSHPVKQGFIQSLGVFVDTMVVSTCTAFIILISGLYGHGVPNGILLTQASMAIHIGSLAPYLVSISLFLFSFTSVISNYYYGESNLRFLSDKHVALQGYRVLFLAMIVIGPFIEASFVWESIDFMIGVMMLLNAIVLLRLSPTVMILFKDYVLQRKAGLDPVFYADDFPTITGTECWQNEIPENIDEVDDPYFKAMPQ